MDSKFVVCTTVDTWVFVCVCGGAWLHHLIFHCYGPAGNHYLSFQFLSIKPHGNIVSKCNTNYRNVTEIIAEVTYRFEKGQRRGCSGSSGWNDHASQFQNVQVRWETCSIRDPLGGGKSGALWISINGLTQGLGKSRYTVLCGELVTYQMGMKTDFRALVVHLHLCGLMRFPSA